MQDRQPAAYLTFDELERWREIRASIDTLENTHTIDDWQHARSIYYQSYLELAEIYTAHQLDRTRYVDINPATGSVMYEPVTVELVEEGDE